MARVVKKLPTWLLHSMFKGFIERDGVGASWPLESTTTISTALRSYKKVIEEGVLEGQELRVTPVTVNYIHLGKFCNLFICERKT